MAGPTTAERGGERPRVRGADAGPPPAARRRRLRPRLPRAGRLVVLLSAAALLAGFGTWVLYGSDWLRVERAEVAWDGGPRELTRDQVLRAADVPVGSPMASLDTGAVRERLLRRLPRVRSVAVGRSWPHTVELVVTEREAQVLLPTADGFTEVDAAGVRFAETRRAIPGVPVVELDLTGSPSRHRFGEDRVLRGTAAMAAGLPGELRREIRTIRVTSYDAITLVLPGNRTVNWGSPHDTAAKARALTAVMEAARGARHLDVSVPSAPAASGG